MIGSIALAEKKLIAAFQYEKRVPGDRDKIILACRMVDAHAARLRRLVAEHVAQTGQNAPVISERAQSILDYLERAQ